MTLHQLPTPPATTAGLLGPASVCEVGRRCTAVAVATVSNGLRCTSRRTCHDCLPDAVLAEAVEPGSVAWLTVVRLG
jgi:hypothetical protein